MSDERFTADDLNAIGALYECVHRPELWTAALDQIAAGCGGGGAIVALIDPRYGESVFAYHCSHVYAPADQQTYLSTYFAQDRVNQVFTAPAGSFITDQDLWSDPSEFANDPVIRWRAERFGLPRSVGLNLNNGEGWQDCLLIHYAESAWPMTATGRARLRAFYPHVGRALRLSRLRTIVESRYRSFLNALDRLMIGIALIDHHGAVVELNEEARRILAARGGLRVRSGRLGAVDPDDDRQLATVIRDALAGCTDRASRDNAQCAVRVRGQDDPLLIEVLPLREHSLPRGAIAFIIDPRNESTFRADGLDLIYRLTPAEMEVCNLMATGLNNREMGAERGVSPETIKDHMSSALAKTGRVNRLELLKLMVKINPPLQRHDIPGATTQRTGS